MGTLLAGNPRPSIDQALRAYPEPAYRHWLVNVAGLLYVISMHKFAMRDPLSTNTGIQGIIEICGMIGAFACIFAATWKARRQHTTSTACICFVIFGLFALASCWRSYYPTLSFVKGSLLLLVLATVYLASQAGLGQRYFRSIYWSYAALLAIGLMIGLLFPHQYPLFSVDTFSGRTRLSIFDTFPGVMGEDVALLLIVAPHIRARVGWLSQMFLFLMIVLAGGKTSTALLCALLLIRFLSGVRQWRSWRTLVVIFVTACISVFVVFSLLGSPGQGHLFAHSAESIYGTEVGKEAVHLDGRLDLWIASLNLLKDAPILGYGLDGARDIMLKVASWSGSSHNGYLELALSGGVVGFVFFLFGLFFVVEACSRTTRPLRLNSFLVLAYILINASIGNILSSPSYFGLLTLLWLSYEAKADARERELLSIPVAVPRTGLSWQH